MSRETRTTKVYVGGLPNDARKEELENEFSRFGKLQDVWVARNPPGFAFIEFYDERDAKDACCELDGRTVCGQRVRVELSHGKTRGRGRGRGSYDRRDDRRDDRGRRYEDSRGSRLQNTFVHELIYYIKHAAIFLFFNSYATLCSLYF